MKHYNLHTIINSALLLGIIAAGIFYMTDKKQSTAYVNNIHLFNKFDMTKDIAMIEEKKINGKTVELDSLHNHLQSLKNKESEEAKRLLAQINIKGRDLQELRNNYETNLSQSVWNRLNSYISEYSKENSFGLVLGTSGNGNIMFAEDHIDITDKILEYANSKYAGN